MPTHLKDFGYTLIELLIGLGLMVFLFANSLFIYTTVMKTYYATLATNQLDQQLHSAMNLMIQDIRRAGYSANAVASMNTNKNLNPFMAEENDLKVPQKNCILFTYDADSSGLIPPLNTPKSDKRFGYRLFEKTLQSRASTDSVFNCATGHWVNITDASQIQITQLSFTLSPTVLLLSNEKSTLTIRNVTISLTGSLIEDKAITRTIFENIRVRNDRFQA